MVFGTAKISNDLGTLVPEPYWYDETIGVMTESYCGGAAACATAGYQNLGQVDIGKLSAKEKFGSFSFAGGAGIGWVLPYTPQWHGSEGSYSKLLPMFSGGIHPGFFGNNRCAINYCDRYLFRDGIL